MDDLYKNIKFRREELGHSSINTTLGIYTHVFNGATESSRGIADTIESKLHTSATFLPLGKHEKRLIAVSLFPCKRVIVIMRLVF